MSNVLGNSAFLGGVTQDDLKKYLPLSGGTLTGNLNIERPGGYPKFTISNSTTKRDARFELQDGDGALLICCDDLNNYNNKRSIIAFKPETYDNLAGMLAMAIINKDENVEHWYRIYGEHNITAGTSDLTAGTSPLGSGCIHLVYE